MSEPSILKEQYDLLSLRSREHVDGWWEESMQRRQKPGHLDYISCLGISVLSCRKQRPIEEFKQGNNISIYVFFRKITLEAGGEGWARGQYGSN